MNPAPPSSSPSSHTPETSGSFTILIFRYCLPSCVFLQWIPFARHATVDLVFHVLAYRRYLLVDITIWRKSVKCAIVAPMRCIQTLENLRLAITILTAPTLISTDITDPSGWLLSLLLIWYKMDLSVFSCIFGLLVGMTMFSRNLLWWPLSLYWVTSKLYKFARFLYNLENRLYASADKHWYYRPQWMGNWLLSLLLIWYKMDLSVFSCIFGLLVGMIVFSRNLLWWPLSL